MGVWCLHVLADNVSPISLQQESGCMMRQISPDQQDLLYLHQVVLNHACITSGTFSECAHEKVG